MAIVENFNPKTQTIESVLEQFTDFQLIDLVNELTKKHVKDDSYIRKLCIAYYGSDSIMYMINLQCVLLPIVTERLLIQIG